MRTLPESDDVRLREGLIAGSDECLAEAYDTHSSLVYGVALRMTGDRGTAEDITQDVFVELWTRPERFDPGRATLRGWLCLVARRRGIDWLRRRTTQASVHVVMPVPEPQCVEDHLLATAAAKEVRQAVAELPETHRRAVLLAYYDGLTYRQVAQALGIPEGTAKWRLRHALRLLGEHLTA
ncbi:RNA polymerase sigma factor [Symbioplanes lichenis]|uniref:RNA polymerase sigma factor n=1 Tax=Symbioplanes lichenis TaxID=1629072 RepID=UPI002738E1BB|nr:sigma-70 family RNA polymerase sigma factor [Actinoplanes lichenis]